MKLIVTSLLALLFLVGGGYTALHYAGAFQSADQPHECDTQAAHPSDPLRLAPGKTDEEVVGVLALRACTAATKQFPGEGRFSFQFGRALAALKRGDEAQQAFEQAARDGYAPAKFYLAEKALDAYWESRSKEDMDRTIQLLEEAQQSFPPAAERLGQVTCSVEGFENPIIIDAFSRRDNEALNRARLLVALYAQGMQESLSSQLHVQTYCPAVVAQASINYDLDAAVAGDPRNALDRFVNDGVILAASYAGVLFDPVWKGDREKWMTFYKELGKRDGLHLAHKCGCESPFTEEVYAGMVEFARAKRPLSEYAEHLMNHEGTKLFLSPLERDPGQQDTAEQESVEQNAEETEAAQR